MRIRTRGCAYRILIGGLGLLALCLAVAVAGNLLYRAEPKHSVIVDRLSPADKLRLAEASHLRQAAGDQVLPGWSGADIPLILFNESYVFLTGCPQPPPGWQTFPQGKRLGAAWEPVPGDDFLGQPYYRQKLPAAGQTTQAFTVRVGDQWAASMGTLQWLRIDLLAEVRQGLPPALQPLVPYRLVTGLLMPGSDVYATVILHEALHAYQGIRAPDRLALAEQTYNSNSKLYPWQDQAFRAAWQAELDLLNQALRATDQEETLRLARAFLAQRAKRREAAHLSGTLVELERGKEWEEGIAKYGELTTYRLAAQTAGYRPLPELAEDPEFHNYRAAAQKWEQEIAQIRRMAPDESDRRFYYTGFAQAVLLDRLAPGWQARLFDDGVWLETLLAEAVK